jgi:hypothetical protein
MTDHAHDNPRSKNPPVWKAHGDTKSEGFGKDPYEERHRPQTPTTCVDCDAAFVDGRWVWLDEPLRQVAEGVCPACRRIRDAYPAGFLELRGTFLATHRDEILNAVRNVEALEKEAHPLHRIMDLTDEPGAVHITTTDVHLPRRIGEALHHAYAGSFDYQYIPNEHVLRGSWTRDS